MSDIQKEILQELNELNKVSKINSNIVYNQNTTIKNIEISSKTMNENLKVSACYLNLIDYTFGKIYKKTSSKPVIDNHIIYKSLSKDNNLFKNNNELDLNKKDLLHKKNYLDIDNIILNQLKEIKEINGNIDLELTKQNESLLELNNNIDLNQTIIKKNITKIKQLFKK
jgi:hypothetical protein